MSSATSAGVTEPPPVYATITALQQQQLNTNTLSLVTYNPDNYSQSNMLPHMRNNVFEDGYLGMPSSEGDFVSNFNESLVASSGEVVCDISVNPGPDIPEIDYWGGKYAFDIYYDPEYSGNSLRKKKQGGRLINLEGTQKLFTGLNQYFGLKAWVVCSEDMYANFEIRAMPVFSAVADRATPVRRCIIHKDASQKSNEGIWEEYTEHVVRSSHDPSNARYEQKDGHYSVVVPLEKPSPGCQHVLLLYKFMCWMSCTSGIQRRPVKIVFTLECNGQPVGRKSVDIHVSACPKRDADEEESRLQRIVGREEECKQETDMKEKKETVRVHCGTKVRKRPLETNEEDDDNHYSLAVRGKQNAQRAKLLLEDFAIAKYARRHHPDIVRAAIGEGTATITSHL